MGITVETKDCTSLGDAELAEMADMCAEAPSGYEVGFLSKAAEAWVLVSLDRDGNPLKGHDNRIARDGHATTPKVVGHLRRFLERSNAQRARGERAPEVRLQVVLFPGSGPIIEGDYRRTG